MNDLVRTVNAIRNVQRCELHSSIKTVAVILCSPRSGSSLVKNVLASHPDVASLDGEIEPFLFLTKNSFEYGSDSDAISHLKHKSDLIDNIFDDLTIQCNTFFDRNFLEEKWKKRLLLQFPTQFTQENSQKNLIQALHHLSTSKDKTADIENFILLNIFKKEPWKINFYDGKKITHEKWFDEKLKIEEPPFLVPQHNRRPFSPNDVKNKILLFKSPPDVYRIGMYEELFPNAKIKYIHLTRGYAQTINGLLDGWMSPVGFFSHDMRHTGLNLNIKGYSDRVPFGKWWWKFDLPPNWREFVNQQLENVCLNQWLSAHEAIFSKKIETLRVSFEDFLLNPNVALRKIENYLGLQQTIAAPNLPIIMATEAPKLKRWNKRKDLILSLGEHKQVQKTMELLGYEMNSETWL